MATAKESASKRGDLHYFRFTQLRVIPGFNLRTEEEVRENALKHKPSIQEEGILEPVTGKWNPDLDVVDIKNGHCRYEAARMIYEETGDDVLFPVFFLNKYTNENDEIKAQFTRNSGTPLSDLAEAEGFRRLMNLNKWSESEVAQFLNTSTTNVTNKLTLLTASPETLQLVKEGKVAPSTAVKAIKDYGNSATEVLKSAVAIAESNGKEKASGKHIEAAVSGNFPVDENGQLTLDQSEFVPPGGNKNSGGGNGSGKFSKAKGEKKILPQVERISVKAIRQAVENFIVESSVMKPESPGDFSTWNITISRVYLEELFKVAGMEKDFAAMLANHSLDVEG